MLAQSPKSTDGIDHIMALMPAYGSEFAKTYANHAPMVLVALDRLGGTPERLNDFFVHYRDFKQLLPFVPRVAPLSAADWQVAIGQRDREADLRDFFDGEVARMGIEAALQTYLGRLAGGVGASALHALMRTAYALLRRDQTETAAALAYWAATYLALPAPTGAAALTSDPAEVLMGVNQIEAMHHLEMHELLWQNMAESGRCAAFRPVIDWLEIDAQTPGRLAASSIALFAATMDFCALHAVTGMHWMRLVLPYCTEQDLLLRVFWQCVAALMGEMKFPQLPNAATLDRWRQLPVPGWDAIKARAALSYDEHDISLVFSASQEMMVYGDPLYQLAAARRVGLVPAYT